LVGTHQKWDGVPAVRAGVAYALLETLKAEPYAVSKARIRLAGFPIIVAPSTTRVNATDPDDEHLKDLMSS
jgi:hypothetical protein